MVSENKLKIGIDIDEVVADFMRKFLEFYNLKNGRSITPRDIKIYHLWENEFHNFGGSRESGIVLVDEFHDSDFFDKIELIKGAKESIDELKTRFEIVFISARAKRFEEKTNRFFKKYFPEDNFQICYSGDLHEGSKSKAEICSELGVDVHIDDNQFYSKDIADKGIKVLLFDKPWNQNHEEHDNIEKVFSWDEIMDRINGVEREYIQNKFKEDKNG